MSYFEDYYKQFIVEAVEKAMKPIEKKIDDMANRLKDMERELK